jgi:hypothetical protein
MRNRSAARPKFTSSPPIADSDDLMVLTVPGDVAEPGVGQRIVDTALERFGRIDTVDAFTDDAIFQGLHPYSVGRQAVAAYYAAQPRGIAVCYLILKTRSPINDLVLGYVSAQFTFPEPTTATDAEICRKGSS